MQILIYVGLCALIGYFGKDKKFGFIGNFFLSLFLTPVVGFIVWLVQTDKAEKSTDAAKSA